MAEIINKKPLFTGKNEEDQMRKIFGVLGAPDESQWPELNEYSEFQNYQFDEVEPKTYSQICPRLDEAGVDLLQNLLQCNPALRVDAKTAMDHEWFDDVREDLEASLYSS